MKKIKLINIPIYKRWLIISNDEAETQLIRQLYECEPYELKGGVCSRLNDNLYLIGSYNNTLSILNHEIVHFAMACLENGDTYDVRESNEQLAYLIEFITEIVYQELGIPNVIDPKKKSGFTIKPKYVVKYIKLKE